jgi:hypothetical protein
MRQTNGQTNINSIFGDKLSLVKRAHISLCLGIVRVVANVVFLLSFPMHGLVG